MPSQRKRVHLAEEDTLIVIQWRKNSNSRGRMAFSRKKKNKNDIWSQGNGALQKAATAQGPKETKNERKEKGKNTIIVLLHKGTSTI